MVSSSVKCILFVYTITLLITDAYAQSEYGENYEYYEATDNEYYYGDYGEESDDSGLGDLITTEETLGARTAYPSVGPYSDVSRGNGYYNPPLTTTPRSTRFRQPDAVPTQSNYNIRGYDDGWVEESGRRRAQLTTTTRRPTYAPTYPSYQRTKRPPIYSTRNLQRTTSRPISEESEESEESVESDESGENMNSGDDEEKGNLLHYLGYRKEDRSCPEGWVMDIYGYCRERFLMERRDWDWWWNIRNFYFGGMDSGYQSSYK